jgi:hypothetical protein
MQAGTPTERQRRQENSIKLTGSREDRPQVARQAGGRQFIYLRSDKKLSPIYDKAIHLRDTGILSGLAEKW